MSGRETAHQRLMSRVISMDPNYTTQAPQMKLQRKLLSFIVVFVFTWMFGLLNRSYQEFCGCTNFYLSFLQALFVPSQGLFNAFIYGSLIFSTPSWFTLEPIKRMFSCILYYGCFGWTGIWWYLCDCCYPSDENGQKLRFNNRSNTVADQSLIVNRHVLNDMSMGDKQISSRQLLGGGIDLESLLPNIKPKKTRRLSMFITTWNMGECQIRPLSHLVKEWIPLDHDIYIIGVQVFNQHLIFLFNISFLFCHFLGMSKIRN